METQVHTLIIFYRGQNASKPRSFMFLIPTRNGLTKNLKTSGVGIGKTTSTFYAGKVEFKRLSFWKSKKKSMSDLRIGFYIKL